MPDLIPNEGQLVDVELGRVITQYREAERLTGYVKAVLQQVEEAARVTAGISAYFDLDTAVGDQLTLVGKRMGFPRCHCVCEPTPVFGFACDVVTVPPVVGFCEDGVWQGCGGVSTLCIADDDVYRSHLRARRYQMLGLFDIESLGAALRTIWGPTAWIPAAGRGRVVVTPGRDLDTAELQRLQVTLRILPIAPGVRLAMHFGSAPVFGFGAGWAGFCEDGEWLCPTVVDPYSCN